MFCSSCGEQNEAAGRFCQNCGSTLSAVSAPAMRSDALSSSTEPPMGTPVSPSTFVPARATGTVAVTSNYATWANRVIAYMIDFTLVAGGMFALYLLGITFLRAVASVGGRAGTNVVGGGCCLMIILFPLATVLVGLYNRVYLISTRGYSIGQGVMKLKVVDADGRLLGAGTLVIRLLAQAVIDVIPVIGFLDVLWPLWDQTRQTLHDKAVGSFVINNPATI